MTPDVDRRTTVSSSHLTCMGLSPVKGLFALAGQLICDCCLGFADSSLFGAEKAVLRPVACDGEPVSGMRRRAWQSIFQHILEIPLRQSGRRILRDPPLASARYLVTIPLVTPPIIAGSSRRVNSASPAWSGQLR